MTAGCTAESDESYQKEHHIEICFFPNGGLVYGNNVLFSRMIISYGEDVNFTWYSEGLSRDGYKLLGWSKDKDAAAAEYYADGVYSFDESAGTLLNLYAVWERN